MYFRPNTQVWWRKKTVEIGNWWKSVTGDEQAQSSSPDWKGSSFDFESINLDWNPIYGQNLTWRQYWLKIFVECWLQVDQKNKNILKITSEGGLKQLWQSRKRWCKVDATQFSSYFRDPGRRQVFHTIPGQQYDPRLCFTILSHLGCVLQYWHT